MKVTNCDWHMKLGINHIETNTFLLLLFCDHQIKLENGLAFFCFPLNIIFKKKKFNKKSSLIGA